MALNPNRTDITPATDSDSQVTVGDRVRVSWRLDADADPADVTFSIYNATKQVATGADLSRSVVDVDGAREFRFSYEFVLDRPFLRIDFRLQDPVNSVSDVAKIRAVDTFE